MAYGRPGAFAVRFQGGKEFVTGDMGTTDTRMLLRAMIATVAATPDGSDLTIYTESRLFVDSLNGHVGRGGSNDHLWAELDRVCKRHSLVTFTWPLGQKKDELNGEFGFLRALAADQIEKLKHKARGSHEQPQPRGAQQPGLDWSR